MLSINADSLTLFAAFLAGVATSLTPCVYPMIPITVAIFAPSVGYSRTRSFLRAGVYVLGMACVYTTLGLISAWSGSLLGGLLGNPSVVLALAAGLLFMALWTLEIVQIPFIYAIQAKAGGIGSGSGYLGIMLMGAASGLVAAPCAAPVLVAILGVAASAQTAWRGAALLLAYALGFGLLFLLVGTFSGLIGKLPKAGRWLAAVKFILAAALVSVAVFLARPFVPGVVSELWFGMSSSLGWSLVSSVALLGIIASLRSLRFITAVCALSLGWGATALMLGPIQPPASPHVDSGLVWQTSIDQALSMARQNRRLVMADFVAEWCAACKEFEMKTFPAPQVVERLKDFELARIDLTKQDETSDELQERFQLIGLPSILFLCHDSREIPKTRVEGFLAPAEFESHLKEVERKAQDHCREGAPLLISRITGR